jgi:membrane-associated protein
MVQAPRARNGVAVPVPWVAVFETIISWIEGLAAAPWFPLVVFAVAMLDSVIPAVPSETTVIIGGVAAGYGDQSLPVIIIAGALGAFIGDNLAYQLGSSGGPWVRRRGSDGLLTRLEWASGQLRRRGGGLLITARFIPGGRTAVTLASGLTHQPRARFVIFVAVAAVIWATYGALLGYLFGEVLEDNHTAAFLLAFGLALAVNILIELVRRRRERAAEQAERADSD